MSFAAIAKGPRILTLDIERMKGSAQVEFWDLGDFKNRRIHADDVTEWPRTICAAWRILGERRIDFASEWGDGRDKMIERIWAALDAADVVVGHNFQNFDAKHLNTDFLTMGLGRPAPYKIVDTLKIARAAFGAESKTLDALNKRLGHGGKTDRYDVEVARQALAGHKSAQKRIERYNRGDIVASENLYLETRAWATNHPHLGLYTGVEASCHVCGGIEFDRTTRDVIALAQSYAGYRCKACGAISRNNHRRRITTMRPAR